MKRREPQSSALSFMDCICCGFGAVLLLFILTAKSQIVQNSENAQQSIEAAQTLHAAIEAAEAKQQALQKDLSARIPQPKTNATSLADLAAEQERLAKAIELQTQKLDALRKTKEPTEAPASLDRPSADQKYLSGMRLSGPKTIILLESSGSMLAKNANEALQLIQAGTLTSDKWLRAKAAVRAVLAAIPKGTQVALLHMNENTGALSGSAQTPYFDPYDNNALLAALERLDQLQAKGGANLEKALRTIAALREPPSSLLLIGDGLPTAPAASGSLSEGDRVGLFNRALTTRPTYPFNVILFPFEGDPSAAGLFWNLSTRTGGITLIPDEDWPEL